MASSTPPIVHNAASLARAMGESLPFERYRLLFPAVVESLRACGCTTVDRAAMWLAQIGHESAGLRYMEEIASGADYEGRTDLGNTEKGDGVRFKGRGPIQVTGRTNYTELSAWAHENGYVPSSTFFVDHPEELASDEYGFLGVTWYWTVARPQINTLADDRDLDGVTRAINGGLNGLADRTSRYEHCLRLAEAASPPKRRSWLRRRKR
ncbi:glycoside hydrolase family 19 protein [Gordonia sp. (in: high G+C Gram-positive bacteria)]|uniref:glycoside hydrolase family 19 protein n=1 Tax=Gordonia sp. (in: high G+C Gram-positive bacteria) TaxID=84139 RepID=UPI0039E52F4A